MSKCATYAKTMLFGCNQVAQMQTSTLQTWISTAESKNAPEGRIGVILGG